MSIQAQPGDKVKIMRGRYKGNEGEVRGFVDVDGIVCAEIRLYIRSRNLMTGNVTTREVIATEPVENLDDV